MRFPRIVLAATVIIALTAGVAASFGGSVSAQTATPTATATSTSTATATATSTATGTATATATSTATATATATATTQATTVPTVIATAVQVQPVVVTIPTSTVSTPGTLTAFVNGQPCGTVTITGTSNATFNLPPTCTIPGAAISFQTASGTALPQTATIPAQGGAVTLGAQASGGTGTTAGTAPRPPATGNAGLANEGGAAPLFAAVAAICLAGAVVTIRKVTH